MINWYRGSRNQNINGFSIIIPSWNNLPFLKLCLDSIEKNSLLSHQVIVHVNDGSDGTLEWIRDSGYDYTHSYDNAGICWAMNACRTLVKSDYIAFLNDDMYVLPKWDVELWNEIQRLPDKFFFLSSTVIEPVKSPHPGVLSPYNFGTSHENFMEEDLLRDFESIPGKDWSGATWPPNVVHRNIWDLVGGYSIEFFPGLYSDPDFSMKLYEAGVRYFKGVNASRVYHFGSKSTRRTLMNNGSKQFLNKWGITSATFTRLFLKRGMPFEGNAGARLNHNILKIGLWKSRLKRIFWLVTGTGKARGKFSYDNFQSGKRQS